MRRLLLVVPALLALLAGGLLLGVRRAPDGAGPVERAEESADSAPPVRLVGQGERETTDPSDGQVVGKRPTADLPPASGPTVRALADDLPDGVVAGRVVKTSGDPITDARVELVNLHPLSRRHTFTDAEGRFRFDGADAESHLIFVDATGWACVQGSATPGRAPLEIVTVPEERIEGVVVDALSGRTVSGLRVEAGAVIRAGAGRPAGTRTNEDGRFLLRGLAPGPYEVMVGARSR